MPVQTKAGTLDPKSFLLAVLNNPDADCKLRINAALTLLPFIYSKIREAGKEEGQQQAPFSQVRRLFFYGPLRKD